MPARRYTLEGRLGQVTARGAKLKADVAEAVTGANLSFSTGEVTQLTLTLTDTAEFTILNSRIFDAGTPTAKGSHLTYGNLTLECRAVEVAARGADHVLTVTARSSGACALKRFRGPLIRRNVTPTQFVHLEAKRAGLGFVGQPTATRRSVSRQTGDQSESSWDTCQRLAQELGFVCFESYGVLYFGQPTWLVQHRDELRVTWRGAKTDDGIDALPGCRRSGDDAGNAATVTASLRGGLGDRALPGMALVLAGVPTFNGRYLVTDVTLDLGENAPANVTAATPINPVPEPPEASSSSTGSGAVSLPSAKGLKIKGRTPERGQLENAVAIFRAGIAAKVGTFGIRVAIATAIQESTLRNLSGGDRDSVGLFQQRASWGSYATRHDPIKSAALFYKALKRVRDWSNLTLSAAAQAVQRSATPNAYAQWAGEATAIVAAIAATASSSSSDTGGKTASHFVSLCLAQAGDNYVFGAPVTHAKNPNTFDCSELVQWAAYRCGVKLPRVSGDQYQASRKISVAKAVKTRGALLFEGPGGSQHVAVSLGNGKTIEAADTELGVCSLSTRGRGFTLAGLVPGLKY